MERRNARVKSGRSQISSGARTAANSRPTSAKSLYDYNTKKRNEDFLRREKLEADVLDMKKRQFEAQFYTNLCRVNRYLLQQLVIVKLHDIQFMYTVYYADCIKQYVVFESYD